MKIVVKVGTGSILSPEGLPLESIFKSLVDQLVHLRQLGHQIILVSSGAVASGRKTARHILHKEFGYSIAEKQILASLGQHELMRLYAALFGKQGMLTCQVLLTKQDFHTKKHYLNILTLFREILRQDNMIPIVNENDSVAIEELMFTDNDELSGLISAQIEADKLMILSNVDGVYTGNPGDVGAHLIPRIASLKEWPKISSLKSSQGRGGMISKMGTAKKASSLGIMVHIANMNEPSVIVRIVQGEAIGTVVLPAHKKSNVKRWIAHHEKQGSITVNAGLCHALKDPQKIISILPVGIQTCSGDFKKGDVVHIMGPGGTSLGVGVARYDASKLEQWCGQKNKPIFIHYDYLHISEAS